MLTASDADSSYAFTYEVGGNVIGVDNDGTANVPHVVLHYVYDAADNHRLATARTWVTRPTMATSMIA